MSQTTEPLVQYLEQMQASGQSHIALSSEARKMLRSWFVASRKKQKVAVVPTALNIEQEEVTYAKEPTAVASVLKEESVTPFVGSERSETLPVESLKNEVPQERRSKTPLKDPLDSLATNIWQSVKVPEFSGHSKEEQIDSLKVQAESYSKGKTSLHEKLIFSKGNLNADIVIMGEAPGIEEEASGEPFSGLSGEKLTAIIKAMGVNPNDVYFSYMVKYRPQVDSSETELQNRAPDLLELQSFLGLVKAEMSIIKPKVIIGLGTSVARGLLQEENLMISAARGREHRFEKTPVFLTYHPSFLIRNEQDLSRKRKVWEDMLMVMEHLSLPINNKQRGYFLPKG